MAARAAFLREALVEKAVLAKPSKGAVTDTPDDALEHVSSRRCEAVEADLAGVVRYEDAVADDGVKMKVQIETAAEPLNMVAAACWLPAILASRFCSRATASMKMRPSARATSARNAAS
jgi:hypothetical protein